MEFIIGFGGCNLAANNNGNLYSSHRATSREWRLSYEPLLPVALIVYLINLCSTLKECFVCSDFLNEVCFMSLV